MKILIALILLACWRIPEELRIHQAQKRLKQRYIDHETFLEYMKENNEI